MCFKFLFKKAFRYIKHILNHIQLYKKSYSLSDIYKTSPCSDIDETQELLIY